MSVLYHICRPVFLFLLCGFLVACSGGGSGGNSGDNSGDSPGDNPGNPPDAVDTVQVNFKFDIDTSGWIAGFADYPVGEDISYELASGFAQLPAPLQSLSGFSVSGRNSSDDLFMFIKKRYDGFAADSQYQITFEITFATNAPANCVGAGGAPGEGVTLKAGASSTEPLVINNGNNKNVMNIDKGNQSTSGSDAIAIGHFANSKKCNDKDFTYELKTLTNDTAPFRVLTDSDGALWFTFSTDSGFESTTRIYYISGQITATKI